jgi:hypothetical protein
MDADDGAVAVAVAEPAVRRHRRADPFRLRPLALVESVDLSEPVAWPPRGILRHLLPSDPNHATAADVSFLEGETVKAYEAADRDYDELLAAFLYVGEVVYGERLTREQVEAIWDGREPVEGVTEPAAVGRDPDPFRRLHVEQNEATASSATAESRSKTKPMTQKERKELLKRVKSTPAWSRLKRREKDVLSYDLQRYGPTTMFSAHATLAEEMGCSKATVRRAREGLVDKGVLLREFRLNGAIFGS